MTNDPIYDALRTDPLLEAEKITGKSYKEDETTSSLGFLLSMEMAERKRNLLAKSNDTYFGMGFDEAVDIFHNMGFIIVGSFSFKGKSWADDGAPMNERQQIMWHPDGFLANLGSYQETGLNTAKLYYNIIFDETKFTHGYARGDYENLVELPAGEGQYTPDGNDNTSRYTSSGHYAKTMERLVWVGDHDAREGVRNTIERLRSAGEILPIWEERPWLWLLNYMDTKQEGYDYKQINEERIAALPAIVRDMIGKHKGEI